MRSLLTVLALFSLAVFVFIGSDLVHTVHAEEVETTAMSPESDAANAAEGDEKPEEEPPANECPFSDVPLDPERKTASGKLEQTVYYEYVLHNTEDEAPFEHAEFCRRGRIDLYRCLQSANDPTMCFASDEPDEAPAYEDPAQCSPTPYYSCPDETETPDPDEDIDVKLYEWTDDEQGMGPPDADEVPNPNLRPERKDGAEAQAYAEAMSECLEKSLSTEECENFADQAMKDYKPNTGGDPNAGLSPEDKFKEDLLQLRKDTGSLLSPDVPASPMELRALGKGPEVSDYDKKMMSLVLSGELSVTARNDIIRSGGDITKLSPSTVREVTSVLGTIEAEAVRQGKTIGDRIDDKGYITSITVDGKAAANLKNDGVGNVVATVDGYLNGTLPGDVDDKVPLKDTWSNHYRTKSSYKDGLRKGDWAKDMVNVEQIGPHYFGNITSEGKLKASNGYGSGVPTKYPDYTPPAITTVPSGSVRVKTPLGNYNFPIPSTGNKIFDGVVKGLFEGATQSAGGDQSGNPSFPINALGSIGGDLGKQLSNLFGGGKKSSTKDSDDADTAALLKQSLNGLVGQHQKQLDQLISQNPSTNPTSLNKLLQLQNQHLQQLQQFKDKNKKTLSGGNERQLDKQITALKSQIKKVEGLIKEKGGQNSETMQNVVNDYTEITGILSKNPYSDVNTTPINSAVSSDLTVVALKAHKTSSGEYRFSGSLSRTLTDKKDNLAFGEVGSYFGSSVAHRLLLDFDCDGEADDSKEFLTPYYSILPRTDGAEALLSEYMDGPDTGIFCFAFEVDIDNNLTETNENNNVSNWREINASLISESVDADLPALNFEISVYTADYKTLTQDWTSKDVIIEASQEIAFRWDAPTYDQCVPLLSSLTPDVLDNLSPLKRNTLSEGVELHEHTGYYEIRCTSGDDTRVESIHLKVLGQTTNPNNPSSSDDPDNITENDSSGGFLPNIPEELMSDDGPYEFINPSIAGTPQGNEQSPPQEVISHMSEPEKVTYVEALDYLSLRYVETGWSWKDKKAAVNMGFKEADYIRKYVIEGMHPKLVVLMASAGKAMEKDGIKLQITSGFRDNYRQGLITSGTRASVGNSWHGGSNVTRGYRDGKALDISGASAQAWIDKNGSKFGLARPYGSGDAPHVALASSGEAYNRKGRRGGMSPAAVDAIYNKIISAGVPEDTSGSGGGSDTPIDSGSGSIKVDDA